MHADASGRPRFVTRRFEDGDEAAVLDLFDRSFHVPRTTAHFDWKYRRDPFGSQHISVTYEFDRLVGNYGAYVVPIYDAGGRSFAHQIGDVMTDPSVRHVGRGPSSILGRTALHFYETFCEGRVAFNYGFTVGTHQKFSLRFLRSDRVEPVPYRLLDLAQRPLSKLMRGERYAHGWRIEVASSLGAEATEMFGRVASQYGFLVRRDAEYLRWRYFDRPDERYFVVAIRKWWKLVGWSVFRARGEVLSWVDALFDPRWPDAPAALLRQFAGGLDVRTIEGWFPRRPAWFDVILRELGFEDRPEPQDLSLMCVPFLLSDATARMRESLYYTMGDGDLI